MAADGVVAGAKTASRKVVVTASSHAARALLARAKVFRAKAFNDVKTDSSVAMTDSTVVRMPGVAMARALAKSLMVSSAKARAHNVTRMGQAVPRAKARSVVVRCKSAATASLRAVPAWRSSRAHAEHARVLRVQINGVTAPSMANVAPVT